jgi:LAO/AO transport system kinase
MGTRGHLGGVAEAALQTTLLLDAAGCDVVFCETVGAGQSEVEVIGVADVVVLVLMPGSGDSVQALKAGIMEIPDVIAVNKMDHPTAQAMAKEVRSVVALDPDAARRPPVLLTEALGGGGVPELWAEIEGRREALAADGRLEERRRRNLSAEVVGLATARARARIEAAVGRRPALEALVERVGRREIDPVSAAEEILTAVLGGDGDDAAGAR